MSAPRQSRMDSLMEAMTSTAIGFVVSLVTWNLIAWAMVIPTSFGDDILIIGIFTAVSIARQYVLRRLFDGRSPWGALRQRFSREETKSCLN